ncbi:hypothetical protein KBD81_03605 [Candidatus Woesebacteria bacterium]|nr:hypothetical protein [Candidatus Woesebacteria bacterium]
MEFNKLVSLVLGFIVLILVFVWISNRVKSSQTVSKTPTVTVTISKTPTPKPTETEGGTIWNPFSSLFNKKSPTPTPSPKKGIAVVSGMPIATTTTTTTPVQIRVVEGTQTPNSRGQITYTNSTTGKVQQIPETGAATFLIPLSFAALSAGIYLKKRS